MSAKAGQKSPYEQSKSVAQTAAEHYRADLAMLRKAFGTRPWDDANKLSQAQKLAAYAAVRDDDQFWTASVHVEGSKLHLSDGITPRSLLEDAQRMESRYQKALSQGTLPGPDALPPNPTPDAQAGG